MNSEQRIQAEYVAEHLLGWTHLTEDGMNLWYIHEPGIYGQVDSLLTGDGMLAILEAMRRQAYTYDVDATAPSYGITVTFWRGAKYVGDELELPAAVLAAAYQATQMHPRQDGCRC